MGLRVAWNCKFLCHHCMVANKDGYVKVPSDLPHLPRRSVQSFMDEAMDPNNRRFIAKDGTSLYRVLLLLRCRFSGSV